MMVESGFKSYFEANFTLKKRKYVLEEGEEEENPDFSPLLLGIRRFGPQIRILREISV